MRLAVGTEQAAVAVEQQRRVVPPPGDGIADHRAAEQGEARGPRRRREALLAWTLGGSASASLAVRSQGNQGSSGSSGSTASSAPKLLASASSASQALVAALAVKHLGDQRDRQDVGRHGANATAAGRWQGGRWLGCFS